MPAPKPSRRNPCSATYCAAGAALCQVESYILVTTEPNELAAKVHDRMPVMLRAPDMPRWLSPSLTRPEDVHDLLGPHSPDEMAAHAVSRRVNKPENERPELIQLDESAKEPWS